MKAESFIYFFTICGFFIGIIFSILNFESAEGILIATLGITLMFYVFIHFILIYFTDIKSMKKALFSKKQYEEHANAAINEIESREQKITSLLNKISDINKSFDQRGRTNA